MMKNSLLGATALRSLLFLGTIGIAAPALATDTPPATTDETAQSDPQGDQDTPDTTASSDSSTETGIVVTGSRIRRPNLDSPVPITTVEGKQFFETGRTSVGDSLNDLPALRSTFSQSNSTRFLGTSGLNLLDLRGLGTQRTLVLVNGRRHVAGDILSDGSSVDVNTIPTDLIDRVDVVTGGDSAVYGSDALAGVVNFVLKDHYEGLMIRGQGGVSEHGDAGNEFVSLLAGTNFADDRGNVAVNFEYAHQSDWYASQRAAYRNNNGFVRQHVSGTASDPTYGFFHDIRSGTYSNGGTFLACCKAYAGDEIAGGLAYIPYLFQPDGTLVEQTGTPVGYYYRPSYLGGNGDNFRDGTQFAFQPKLDRYSANLVAHFEVSTALVPFVEATYTRTDSFGSAAGPFFTSALGETFHTDNPFLTSQARSIIRNAYGDYYTASGASGSDGINDADQFGFGFYKNAVDLTNRSEAARRETFRVVAGLRGDFNDDWHYELSANYGQFNENTRIEGNVNLQRYFLAIDAVDQGTATTGVANGNIVCRAQVDPAAAAEANDLAINSAGVDATYANSHLSGDVSACVPVNLFGNGKVTDAARQYLLQNSYARGKITQFVLSGFVNGDTSSFLNLPGGPIGFAAGFEYRRETNYYKQDDATSAAATFYNAIPEFNPPAFEVKEAYAEVRIPLLKDIPLVQELTLNGAARVADYRGSTGTVFAYNGGVEYSPFRGLRLRGNYSRAVRAPNLSDLYTPLGQNYFGFDDPCAVSNRNQGSQYREANCLAAGVPANYDYHYTATPGYLSGGNPSLQAETSDSYTLGGVFQPTFIRGLSFSADYYHITVNNVISTPDPQGIINACYDLPTITNQFCSLFQRDTSLPVTQGEYVNNSLHDVPLNYAKLVVSGIDFDLGFEHDIGDLGHLTVHGVYTLALQASNYLDPTNPGFEDRTLSELGDPTNAFNLDVAFKREWFTIGYRLQYLDKMYNGAYENYNSLQGRAPENPYLYAKEYQQYPVVVYHNIRLEFDVNKDYNFYLGVDNLTNKLPPFGLTGAGGGSSIYPNVGRFFYAGAQAKF